MDDKTPLASVTEVTGLGMVQIRADLDYCGDAIAEAAGLAIPAQTRIVTAHDRALGWMAHDELLLILPRAEAAATEAQLDDALADTHHLVLDVSDMRCVFDVTGPAPEQVLAKLSPTDFTALPEDGLRRTRVAQVAAAFWPIPGGFRVIAFRSVSAYLRKLLETAAAPGSSLDPR